MNVMERKMPRMGDDSVDVLAENGGKNPISDAVPLNIPLLRCRSPNTWVTAALLLISGGTFLGLVMPRNAALPGPTWQILSNVVGYTYFLAWSASFYPQLFLNARRGTTFGLSTDFCALNVLGYACYTVYTTEFYWNQGVRETYRQQMYGNADDAGVDGGGWDEGGSKNESGSSRVTVAGNDVAFAIHALVMASVMLAQIGYYDTFSARPPSLRVIWIISGAVAICFLYVLTTWTRSLMIGPTLSTKGVDLLGFLYMVGAIKVIVTFGKYAPQVLLNASRKSTVGWNVTNVLLDLTGGILSFIQLIGDCADVGDWTGIIGNPAKIALSLVTIGFDLIFLFQHYVLYPDCEEKLNYSSVNDNIEIE